MGLNCDVLDVQVQSALRRKWAQWTVAWGKTGWGETSFVSHHLHFHTNSSITETSRTTGSVLVPVSGSSNPQTEHFHLMSLEPQRANGQETQDKDAL